MVQLEEKLALAERGVTDRVIEERNELKQAVKRQEQNVKQEVQEAQGAATQLNTEAERARRELQGTQPPEQVQADVKTERKVIPSTTEVEVQKEQQRVPIETNRMIERQKTTAPTTPTTPTTPTMPASP